MKTQLLSLMAAAALLAMAVPATAADSDAKIPIPPPATHCSGITVNDVQECANYAIDTTQNVVEYALVVVCDIACNFATGSAAVGGPHVAIAVCGDPTVNGVQECLNNVIDYSQDRVEYVLVVVCNIACDFAQLSSAATAAELEFARTCGDLTVNGVQDCANDYIDYTQYLVEYGLDLVCDIACNFATASNVGVGGPVVTLRCNVTTVNGIQECVNWAIDYTQFLVEVVITLVCDVACDFAQLSSSTSALDADVALACGDLTVNGVQDCANNVIDYAEALVGICGTTINGIQQCLNYYIDYVQYLIEWTLDLVCDIACNFVATPELARAE